MWWRWGASSGEPGDTTEYRDSEGTAIANTKPIQVLWVISPDVESLATFENDELEFEKGEMIKVFQITSTDVQGEIEIKPRNRSWSTKFCTSSCRTYKILKSSHHQ